MKLTDTLKHQLMGIAFQVLLGQMNSPDALATALEDVAAAIRAQIQAQTPHQ